MNSSDQESYQRQRYRSRDKNKQRSKNNDCILEEVYRILSTKPIDHHKLSQNRHYTKLTLRIIQKKPLYLADKRNCIQALYKPQLTPKLNPFNQLINQFYTNHPKPQILFNCRDQIINQQTPLYPSAYHPAFFYKNYQYFKEKKSQAQILVNCQIMQIKCWSLAIVNVSKTGYYAPVLMIHDWKKRHGENQNMDKLVQNILFQNKLTPILDAFRLQDIRKSDIKKPSTPYNFSYYMRNHISLNTLPKASKFVNLDVKGNIIRTNDKQSLNIIPLGNMSQTNFFKRPIPPKYLNQRKQINLFKFVQYEQNQQNYQSSSQFSQSQQEQGEIISGMRRRREQINDQQQNINDENRMADQYLVEIGSQIQQSDEQDYLKKIYKKVLTNSKIV